MTTIIRALLPWKSSALLVTTLFLASAAYSQTITPSVISSNGNYSQTPQGSLAWTIGEPVSDTYASSSNIITMGFHQPELDLATLIKEYSDNRSFLVYPNPVLDELTVNLDDIDNGIYQFELIDGLGRLMLKTETTVAERSKSLVLHLNELSSGNYYLIINKGTFSKTIKINKIK